jgi:hypothetical protein
MTTRQKCRDEEGQTLDVVAMRVPNKDVGPYDALLGELHTKFARAGSTVEDH